MSAPVDVLAVIGRLCDLAWVSGADEGREGNRPAWQLHEDAHKARAAVAELIEVATSIKNALAIIVETDEPSEDMHYRLYTEDLPRVRAALARCGGAK